MAVKYSNIIRNIIIAAIAIFVILINLLTYRPIINKTLSLDEVEEADIGWKVVEMGGKAFQPEPEGNMKMSHPLLYSITQGWVQQIFGRGVEPPLRLYGILHYFLSLVLILLIVFEIIQGDRVLKIWALTSAAALYLLNPLLVQHSVVVNADNNILTTAILFFLYLFIRFEKLEGPSYIWSRFILALSLAVCFWAKEITPVFLFLGILVYRIIRPDLKKIMLDLFCVGLAGFLIFWLTWWAYCIVTGMDAFGFIKFTLINKSKVAFSSRYLKGAFGVFSSGLKWHVFWVSAPFLMALFMFFLKRAMEFFKQKAIKPVDCLFIVGLSIWIPFQFFKACIDMMKYQYPAYAIFIGVIAWLFATSVKDINVKSDRKIFSTGNLAILIIVFSALLFYYYRIGDYLLAIWRPMRLHMNSHFLLYYYLPIAAILSIVAIASRKSLILANLSLACILLIMPINAALGLNQARAKYNTAEIWLNYGESGLKEVIGYLAQRVKDNSVIAVRYDIEYYLKNKYNIKILKNLSPDKLFLTADENVLIVLFSRLPLDFVVIDPVSGVVRANNNLFKLLDQYFILEKQFGNFYIYRRKAA